MSPVRTLKPVQEGNRVDRLFFISGHSATPAKLSQPILLMIEQKDVKGRGEGAEEAAKAVSEHVHVEKCDTYHFMMLEDPEGTNRILDRFLSQHLGRDIKKNDVGQ